MCIIIYKPKDKELPSKEVLDTCFSNNADGCGLTYYANGYWHTRKGFMTFEDFYHTLNRMRAKIENLPVIIHFRMSTCIGIEPEKTHPFPITKNSKLLNTITYKAKQVLAHNGILGSGDTDERLTDTQVFIKTFIVHVKGLLHLPQITDLISDNSLGSRIIIGDGNKVRMYGSWTEDGGILYSNVGYKEKSLIYDDWVWHEDEDEDKLINSIDDSICPHCYLEDRLVEVYPTEQESLDGIRPVECQNCGTVYDHNTLNIVDGL